MRASLQAILLLVALALAGVAQAQNSASATFSIKINTSQVIVRAGKTITVAIAMQNTSDHDISYPGGIPIFDVDLLNVRGKSVKETPLKHRLWNPAVVSRLIEMTLRPGETYHGSLELTELYDLSKPGNYTIQVQRMDSGSKVLVKSNTITVTVTP